MEYLYPNTYFSLRILLIVPVAPGDRSFSKLEVIKACLKGCLYLGKD